jgi:hypothetical protein
LQTSQRLAMIPLLYLIRRSPRRERALVSPKPPGAMARPIRHSPDRAKAETPNCTRFTAGLSGLAMPLASVLVMPD